MPKLPSTNLALYTPPAVADETFTDSHVVFLDSRFRKLGSNTDFVVDFNVTKHGAYVGVCSIELLGMSMNTKTLHDSGEHYAVLKIDELDSRVQSNNPNLSDYFSTVYFDTSTQDYSKAVKGTDFDRKYKQFSPVITLTKLKISIRNGYTGEVFDDDGHTTFLFKIRTQKTNH